MPRRPKARTQARSARTAAEAVHGVFRAEWDWEMEQFPTRASALGDRRWNDRWPDLSSAAIEARHRHRVEILRLIAEIDRSALSAPDRLNYDLFRHDYELDVEGHRFRGYLIPLTHLGGPQTANELGDALRFETVRDYEDWIARLRGFSRYVAQAIALMEEGIRARVLLPKVIVQRVPAQIGKHLVDDPAASPFYKPFTRFPPAVGEPDRRRLAREAAAAIGEAVIPALRALQTFVAERYLTACPDQVGAWQRPAGDALYTYLVRRYTTTEMTPDEVHAAGLEEVARIRAEMDAVKARAGFDGPLMNFFAFLRSDPRFYFTAPDELLTAYRAMAKRIDPTLMRVFRTVPRIPYGVEPIPDTIAPDTTTAYYRRPAADGSRAGTYFVNLYKPEARPKWEMMALSLHEAVPGHHFQIALAMELQDLPPFRRYGGYTAFVEGWALYAESLGDELGLYDDPYAKFGQLTYEMWRAVRLVVDTGIHAMRWDRERAIAYFMEHAPKQELDVVNEIDRYIAWPGQALAYKVGELKITALRARASAALGPRFDVREFHDVVLREGAVPLDILQRRVEAWLGEKGAEETSRGP